MTSVPRLSFSHVGIFVTDIARMEDFYTRVLGFTVTDRGDLETPRGRLQFVFLSRDPREHHQVVMASGRPADLPFNPARKPSKKWCCLSLAPFAIVSRWLATLAGSANRP